MFLLPYLENKTLFITNWSNHGENGYPIFHHYIIASNTCYTHEVVLNFQVVVEILLYSYLYCTAILITVAYELYYICVKQPKFPLK